MSMYAKNERAKYWPVSPELLAQYKDGTQNAKDRYGGDLYWTNQNNQNHRDGDLPAFISINGYLEWRQNGQRHRDGDKPASIGSSGTLRWYKNGQWHRICGPAKIYEDNWLEWWVNGEEITQEVNKWLAGKEWQGTPEQIVEFKLRFA